MSYIVSPRVDKATSSGICLVDIIAAYIDKFKVRWHSIIKDWSNTFFVSCADAVMMKDKSGEKDDVARQPSRLIGRR